MICRFALAVNMRGPVFFNENIFAVLLCYCFTIFLGENHCCARLSQTKEDYFNLYGKGAADSFENRNPINIVKGTKVIKNKTENRCSSQLDVQHCHRELNSVQELNSLRNLLWLRKRMMNGSFRRPVSRIKFSDTKIQNFILSGTEFDSLLLAIQQVKPSINIIQSIPISRSIIIRCSAEILKYNLVENKF
jgi:hypothetical protein